MRPVRRQRIKSCEWPPRHPRQGRYHRSPPDASDSYTAWSDLKRLRPLSITCIGNTAEPVSRKREHQHPPRRSPARAHYGRLANRSSRASGNNAATSSTETKRAASAEFVNTRHNRSTHRVEAVTPAADFRHKIHRQRRGQIHRTASAVTVMPVCANAISARQMCLRQYVDRLIFCSCSIAAVSCAFLPRRAMHPDPLHRESGSRVPCCPPSP